MRAFSLLVTVVTAFACVGTTIAADDFYEILGVTKEATTREIRQAFKKLALKMHPDKNTGDPTAHDKFLRVNRAYEVLKNEDDRKKYDEHGEEGLKEGGPSGRGYQSWNFYDQEFGIYDDDVEIITLSYSDFEQLVVNSEDIWFVNFYSPQCHHCHDLAPSWREVARELDGVVRIGAVNCGDDWSLCRQQGVNSYPSLLMYPKKEKYKGTRTTALLVKHALQFVNTKVHALRAGNYRSTVSNRKPWLITFCSGSGDCIEENTAMKLAAMLNELASIGSVDCHHQEELCEKLGRDGGTFFYETNGVEKGKGTELSSLDAKELANDVLKLLPDVNVLDLPHFQAALAGLKKGGRRKAWLIHFVEGGTVEEVELRKLPALLDDINVGRFECRTNRGACNDLHVHKLPMFVIFKAGGGHEVHHGRTQSAHDIAAFAKNTHLSPARVLDESDFPGTVIDSAQPWFVDFFAPWCPPCMRLLPEFRKASKQMAGSVNFGTVDCTIHKNLCQRYGVNSYPTTIFYNNSQPHHFHGGHRAQDLVDFVQYTLNPTVVALTADSFMKLVTQRPADETWLIDFFAPWCGPCQQLAPEWRKLSKMLKTSPNVRIGSVDCDAEKEVCLSQGVRSYPNIRMYPANARSAAEHHSYTQWMRDANSIRAWAFSLLPSTAIELTAYNFGEKVSWSATPWVVDFHAPWCGHCQVFAPEFELVAQKFKGKVNAGKVNCDQHKQLCRSAGVTGYPSLRFYIGSKDGNPQKMSGEDIDISNTDHIVRFLNSRLPKEEQVSHSDGDFQSSQSTGDGDDDGGGGDGGGGGDFMDTEDGNFNDFDGDFGGQFGEEDEGNFGNFAGDDQGSFNEDMHGYHDDGFQDDGYDGNFHGGNNDDGSQHDEL